MLAYYYEVVFGVLLRSELEGEEESDL